MSSTFSVAQGPPPAFIMRWPWQAPALSQYGDPSGFARAVTDPTSPLAGFDFGASGAVDLRLASGVPMMGTVAGGDCYLIPWGPTPATEAFFTVREWYDQLPNLTVIRALVLCSPTADLATGFGFAISDGSGTAPATCPSDVAARGGAWVRRDSVTGFVVVECYHAGGVLTTQLVTPIDGTAFDVTFRLWRARPQGPQVLPSCDVHVRGDVGGSDPAEFYREGLLFGAGWELPPLGVGVDANTAQFTAVIMNATAGLVATRGAVAGYFPPLL